MDPSITRKFSPIEISEARLRTAMRSPEDLTRWLEASNRRWLVFNSTHLVKSLPWPEGVESLIQFVQAYRDFRSTVPTGRTENLDMPSKNMRREIPIFHGESLELEELDRCIRYLVSQITEIDPNWSLAKDPL